MTWIEIASVLIENRLISTYGGQGTMPQNIIASNHAVIHTGSEKPFVLPEESGLNPAISINSADLLTELDPMSKICYSRVYSISKQVGCCQVGHVVGQSLLRLKQDFARCFEQSHGM